MLEDAERYACLQQRVVGEDDLVGMLGVPVAYKIPVVFARVLSGEAIVAAAVADYVWLISTVVGEVRRRLLGKIVVIHAACHHAVIHSTDELPVFAGSHTLNPRQFLPHGNRILECDTHIGVGVDKLACERAQVGAQLVVEHRLLGERRMSIAMKVLVVVSLRVRGTRRGTVAMHYIANRASNALKACA